MTAGSFALVAFDGRTFVRVVHAGGGQLVWSRPSPPVIDDVGWATATDELTRAARSLRPRPAWACLFADLQYVSVLPSRQPARPSPVGVQECLLDPRWGLPDAYPVVLLPPEWAAQCGFSTSHSIRPPGAGRCGGSPTAHSARSVGCPTMTPPCGQPGTGSPRFSHRTCGNRRRRPRRSPGVLVGCPGVIGVTGHPRRGESPVGLPSRVSRAPPTPQPAACRRCTEQRSQRRSRCR